VQGSKDKDRKNGEAMAGLSLPYKRAVQSLWRCLNRDDSAGLAAEMTYNWMLSLIPALVFMIAMFGMFGMQSSLFDQLMDRLYLLAPRDAYQMLQSSLKELNVGSNGKIAVLSFLGALWTASNGVKSIEKALNRAFRSVEKRRGFLQQQGIAFLAVIGLGLLMLVSANLIVFGEVIFNLIQSSMPIAPEWMPIFNWLRWGLAIGGLVFVIFFIYWIIPDTSAKQLPLSQRVLPGTLLFVPLWILLSWLFSLYVANFANFNKVYGSMGAIIVLMSWLYLTSYILIIGGEVNAMASGCSGDDQEVIRP